MCHLMDNRPEDRALVKTQEGPLNKKHLHLASWRRSCDGHHRSRQSALFRYNVLYYIGANNTFMTSMMAIDEDRPWHRSWESRQHHSSAATSNAILSTFGARVTRFL